MPREPARDLVRGLVATARRLAAGPYGAAAPTAPGPPSAETDDTATDGAAVDGAEADDVARAADLIGLLAAAHPGDVGIAAALLLNDVTLRPGEGLFQPARLLHAYVSGLGIEIMAASDNVLRGGLTPKHIDVDELLRILDPTPSAAPILMPRTLAVSSGGLLRGWDVPVGDFALTEAICTGGALDVGRPMLLLAIEGAVRVTGTADDGTTVAPVELRGGRSALLAGSAALTLTGTGRVFLAASGR
jgi:mannose-6-phosphate isomerase